MVSAIRNNMQSVSSKVAQSPSNIQNIVVHSSLSLELLQVIWQIYLLHSIILRQWVVYQMRVSVCQQQSLQLQYIQNTVVKFMQATANIKCDTKTDRHCNYYRCSSTNMMSAMPVMMRGKYIYTLLLMLICLRFTKFLH